MLINCEEITVLSKYVKDYRDNYVKVIPGTKSKDVSNAIANCLGDCSNVGYSCYDLHVILVKENKIMDDILYDKFYKTLGKFWLDEYGDVQKKQNIVIFILQLIDDPANKLPFEINYTSADRIYKIIVMREYYDRENRHSYEKFANKLNKCKRFKFKEIPLKQKQKWSRLVLLSTLDFFTNQKDDPELEFI